MKGSKKVISGLNGILRNELTAINQYFLHARMMRNWGYERLAAQEYAESIGEMKHADKLIDRILMLDGLPNLQDLGKLKIGESIPEILESDMGAEVNNQKDLKAAIAVCEEDSDYVSRQILTEILDETEEHIDWLESQQLLLEQTGLQNYLQSQIGGDSEGS